MRSVHDNNIYSIDIRCDQGIITLHTEFTEDDPPEYTDVLFTGTIAHQFDNIFSGNIILGIDEYRPLDFYEDFKSELESQSRYGLPIPVESASLFISEIEKKVTEKFHCVTDQDENLPERVEAVETGDTLQAEEPKDGIVTTEEETEGFNIVKAIVRKVVDAKRVTIRDTKSYCGVLLDDNNRKPICRLHFNYSQKYIGIITQKNEERIPIDAVDDIFDHGDKLKATIAEYLEAEIGTNSKREGQMAMQG